MSGEVEHSTATKVYALYGALFKEIAKELGEAKALTLQNSHEYIGLNTGVRASYPLNKYLS